MPATGGDPHREFRTLVQMDIAFHRALAAAAKNPPLAKMLICLHKDAMRFWYFGCCACPPARCAPDIASHLAIVAAIERRDPAQAAGGHAPRCSGTFSDMVQLHVRRHVEPARETCE